MGGGGGGGGGGDGVGGWGGGGSLLLTAALHPVLALLGLVVGWVIYNTAGFSSRSESRAGEKTNINKAGKKQFENNSVI